MLQTGDVTFVASSLPKNGSSDVPDKILCSSHWSRSILSMMSSSALPGLLYGAKTSCCGTRSFTSAHLPFQLWVHTSWTGSLCEAADGQVGELTRRREAPIHSRQCRPNLVHVGVKASWQHLEAKHSQDAAKHVGRCPEVDDMEFHPPQRSSLTRATA